MAAVWGRHPVRPALRARRRSKVSESWTGADGSAWPSQWTVSPNPGPAVYSIQSNTGQMTNGAGSTANARINTATFTDFDVYVQAKFLSGTSTIWVSCGTYTGDVFMNSGYAWNFDCNGDSVGIWVTTAAAATSNLGVDVAVTINPSTLYWLRVQRQGNNQRLKIWDASGSEPASWTTQAADTSQPGAGQVQLGHFSTTATSTQFDNFTLN